MQRVDLYYEIPSRKAGVRLGLDAGKFGEARAADDDILRQLNIPKDEMIGEALAWIRRYALDKKKRHLAKPDLKQRLVAMVAMEYWREGIKEIRFVDDGRGLCIVSLSGRSRYTPPEPIKLPDLPRINVWLP